MKKFTADFETIVSETDCRVWAYATCQIGDVTNFKYGNNIENTASLTLSSVGRVSIPDGVFNFNPLAVPDITLTYSSEKKFLLNIEKEYMMWKE